MKVTMLAVLTGALVACGAGSKGASASLGSLHIRHAVAWTSGDVKGASIAFEVENRSDRADTLVAVTSPRGNAVLHVERPGGGMQPVQVLPLPRHMATRLGHGLHVMVSEMAEQPKVGQVVPVTLRFANGGALDLEVPVLRFTEAMDILGR